VPCAPDNETKSARACFAPAELWGTLVLDSLSSDGKTFVFVTESIENISSGWRARGTYRILNENEFTETFELAAPDKDFEVYIENHFKRKR